MTDISEIIKQSEYEFYALFPFFNYFMDDVGYTQQSPTPDKFKNFDDSKLKEQVRQDKFVNPQTGIPRINIPYGYQIDQTLSTKDHNHLVLVNHELKEVVYTIRGTNLSDKNDILSDLMILVWGSTSLKSSVTGTKNSPAFNIDIYQKAIDIIKKYKFNRSDNRVYKIIFASHSLGATIQQILLLREYKEQGGVNIECKEDYQEILQCNEVDYKINVYQYVDKVYGYNLGVGFGDMVRGVLGSPVGANLDQRLSKEHIYKLKKINNIFHTTADPISGLFSVPSSFIGSVKQVPSKFMFDKHTIMNFMSQKFIDQSTGTMKEGGYKNLQKEQKLFQVVRQEQDQQSKLKSARIGLVEGFNSDARRVQKEFTKKLGDFENKLEEAVKNNMTVNISENGIELVNQTKEKEAEVLHIRHLRVLDQPEQNISNIKSIQNSVNEVSFLPNNTLINTDIKSISGEGKKDIQDLKLRFVETEQDKILKDEHERMTYLTGAYEIKNRSNNINMSNRATAGSAKMQAHRAEQAYLAAGANRLAIQARDEKKEQQLKQHALSSLDRSRTGRLGKEKKEIKKSIDPETGQVTETIEIERETPEGKPMALKKRGKPSLGINKIIGEKPELKRAKVGKPKIRHIESNSLRTEKGEAPRDTRASVKKLSKAQKIPTFPKEPNVYTEDRFYNRDSTGAETIEF